MNIKKLSLGLSRTGGGIFHDSRADSRVFAECISNLERKVNELIENNNELELKIINLENRLDAINSYGDL